MHSLQLGMGIHYAVPKRCSDCSEFRSVENIKIHSKFHSLPVRQRSSDPLNFVRGLSLSGDVDIISGHCRSFDIF